mgnify:CR=1 FL=1
MFNSVLKNGKNIFPEEIETVLLESELIQEVIVYGKEDKKVGNIMVTADIFPNYSLLKEQKLTQCMKIVKYLHDFGSITPVQAMQPWF